MVLRIRLARFGKKHAPFYNIVVAHARYAPSTSPTSTLTPQTQTPQTQPANPTRKPNPQTNPPPTTSTARSARPLEVLGTYNPLPQAPRPGDTHGRPWKDIKIDISRARYWVGVGAQPSDTAWRLLSMVGILEPRFRVAQVQGSVVRSVRGSAAKSLVGEGVGIRESV
ncbi:ribosomal protein S16 [Decorospora gaudefroyi]|uniref:Ribosomal protein S16 n=1 Tax=Decorospora gaudefroyi TaxID=184978 RepID=A0A6A5KQG1_9PLEO|nr:ribosomal protein S16 [Decorospora gaudefroyi]